MGLTGIDVDGEMIEGDDHGKITVDVSGGIVGNARKVETWTASSIGDVFGGGKGDLADANLSRVKNTEVNISGDALVHNAV